MKIISEAMRMMIFIAVVSVIGTHLDRVYRSMSSVQYIMFDTDDALSSTMKNEIESYVHLLRVNGRYNPAGLVDILPRRFSCIESVEIKSLPHNTAQLQIKAHEPLANVSDKQLITRDGLLLSQRMFNQDLLKNIGMIQVVDEIPQAVRAVFVDTITHARESGVAKKYDITWIDEHHINLTDKHNPQISIICSHDRLPTDEVQKKCEQLALAKINQKPQASIYADIRFEDQIIVSMNKGGQHGART